MELFRAALLSYHDQISWIQISNTKAGPILTLIRHIYLQKSKLRNEKCSALVLRSPGKSKLLQNFHELGYQSQLQLEIQSTTKQETSCLVVHLSRRAAAQVKFNTAQAAQLAAQGLQMRVAVPILPAHEGEGLNCTALVKAARM